MWERFLSTDTWPFVVSSCVLQWYNVIFAFWWGIGLATQVRVGFNLGAQRPEAARCVLNVGMIWSVFLGLLLSGLLFLNADNIAYPFTS